MASVGLRPRSLCAAPFGEDVGMGILGDLQGLSLSEMAVAEKEGMVDGEKQEMVIPVITETKSKAAASCTVGNKAVGSVEGVKEACGEEGGEAPVEKRMWRLPDEEVEWVLSWKRGRLTSGFVPPDGVKAFESLADVMEEYQDWMRREKEANGGYVLVDDDYMALREEHHKWLQEQEEPVEFTEEELARWNVSDEF